MSLAAMTLGACIQFAATRYAVPSPLLRAIIAVEGGHHGGRHKNSNDSVDYGLMQINSIWLPILEPYGYTPAILADNDCKNVLAGAYILRLSLNRSEHGFWWGVGHYHSWTPTLAHDYAWRVYRELKDSFNNPPKKAVFRLAYTATRGVK
jgi:hypothetical protein